MPREEDSSDAVKDPENDNRDAPMEQTSEEAIEPEQEQEQNEEPKPEEGEQEDHRDEVPEQSTTDEDARLQSPEVSETSDTEQEGGKGEHEVTAALKFGPMSQRILSGGIKSTVTPEQLLGFTRAYVCCPPGFFFLFVRNSAEWLA